ncbi:hypothetical protein AAG570_010430 [Ranatra chinensis]|uniref:Amyloid protein-binding protein 2 n=1 Tax=Ranatra chinensis TaxID=642074 RepID=A0ABD0YMT0_9HEMI
MDIRSLPETILFDVYTKLYHRGRLCVLGLEFSDLTVFSRMLKVSNNWVMLIKCFQALMNHGTRVAMDLANDFAIRCSIDCRSQAIKESTIDLGIRLGGFLSEAGWFEESIKVLSLCRDACCSDLPQNVEGWMKTLECCQKLLHAQVIYSQIEAAGATKEFAEGIVQELKAANHTMNLAGLYSEFSFYAFQISNYNQAYKWSVDAVMELGPHTCPRVMVDTLSQASKACVVKREFRKASVLVRQAVYLAREIFGDKHPKFADTLLDYGYCLLNSDSIKDSVTVYERALRLKEAVFGPCNLYVAVAHEDLAYALYVHEYSSGRFSPARQHAEDAIGIMVQLLPEEHLMLTSAQRVKALILEEIALDNIPGNSSETLFKEAKLFAQAEKLHKDALRLGRLSFGENNVQTSKHYGNLGRLYQSMKRYEEAEMMHLKAIELKENLLGKDDYEVGLSIGHLASLYNYHMKEYRKAETLYYRSIKISLKLFSETYSGLEYDYRGLMHVYNALGDAVKVSNLVNTMSRWKRLREAHKLRESAPLALSGAPVSLQELQQLMTA